MTERKPADLSFASWIDQQITEAEARGAFDDLPGAGRPLPNRGDGDAGQAWLRDYLTREGIPAEDALPTPLRLRKAAERLAADIGRFRSESEARAAIGDLNEQIVRWRRFPDGPPIFVPLLDADDLIARWRLARADPPAGQAALPGPQSQAPRTARRWWRMGRN
ncbi:MAG: DnaJ family domain-containing protein [Streptosporangiaceae bacterium]